MTIACIPQAANSAGALDTLVRRVEKTDAILTNGLGLVSASPKSANPRRFGSFHLLQLEQSGHFGSPDLFLLRHGWAEIGESDKYCTMSEQRNWGRVRDFDLLKIGVQHACPETCSIPINVLKVHFSR